ncbi:putative ATP-grasp target RiPP [Rhodococcus sp. HNM0563]|uniref:putative ATP-grasp target RiPP n=1 Tax=Rhodococcus sp. HNM0563 TaxID=2716339 RepID=UPI00146C85E4|nr:putative ATP-grasp target RiPP [Rhodococcus sp. HNM0563]NLU63731.1 putative ATP-grasp target RiPP [Rhodococcus sp. HNM0563]
MSKFAIDTISAAGAELDESHLAGVVGGMPKICQQPTVLKLESGNAPDRTLPGDPRSRC